MPRAGLDSEAVVAAAAEMADAAGLDSLRLADLAQRLGVRTPSLYAHVDGLEDLRRRLAARAADELYDRVAAAAAGRSGADALRAVADAYRTYATEHPGSYAAVQRVRDIRGAPGAERLVALVVAALAAYGFEDDAAVHAARVVRAALHGFVTLETGGGFGIPLERDDSYALLVSVLDAGLGAEGRLA
jgi:AcrR family transcriptional regulator